LSARNGKVAFLVIVRAIADRAWKFATGEDGRTQGDAGCVGDSLKVGIGPVLVVVRSNVEGEKIGAVVVPAYISYTAEVESVAGADLVTPVVAVAGGYVSVTCELDVIADLDLRCRRHQDKQKSD